MKKKNEGVTQPRRKRMRVWSLGVAEPPLWPMRVVRLPHKARERERERGMRV
jgi:hypothetical protein